MVARSTLREDQVMDSEFVSPEEHESLHDRDKYIEILRNNNKVITINEWSDITKTFMFSSTAIERTEAKISKIIKTIYDYNDGVSVVATITGTVHRQNGASVSSIEFTRDVDMEGI